MASRTGPEEERESADALLTRQLLDEHHVEGARKIARVAFLICVISVPFCFGVMAGLDRELGRELLCIACAFIALEGAMMVLFGRGFYRPWLDWLNMVLEISVPTLVLALDAHRLGPAYALTSAPVTLYAPAVMLAALRLRPWLALAAGGLAGTELFAAYLALRDGIPADLVRALPSLGFANVLQRSTYVAVSGLAAYFLCRSLLAAVDRLVVNLRKEFQARAALGRQVTRPVADLLLSDGGWATGRKQPMTVLFCDIRGFTRFSEERDPESVVAFLNGYFEVMCAVVDRNGGIVNKFLGDGFLALFGAPLPAPDHALRAARAALEMASELAGLRQRWELPALEIGVGLHTGEAVAGLVGSKERAEYTAIGDVVNVASRIEGLNREFGTRILVSQETCLGLGPGAKVRRVGEAQVKGRERLVDVCELIALESAPARPAA